MNTTAFIAFVFAPLFAVGTFFALRQTLITVHIDVFIRSPPKTVFNYIKEPRNLPLVNHVIRSLEVTNETVVSDRLEYRKWTQTEQLPHVGLTSMKVVAVADQAKQTIQITTAPFYGMVIV
ncbi:hypothetical protein LSAT2_013802 [Lamellibrachia satsuma]|nr:hypothetical protein LSAT2_013802 [Lamellibrachia satsuma]